MCCGLVFIMRNCGLPLCKQKVVDKATKSVDIFFSGLFWKVIVGCKRNKLHEPLFFLTGG